MTTEDVHFATNKLRHLNGRGSPTHSANALMMRPRTTLESRNQNIKGRRIICFVNGNDKLKGIQFMITADMKTLGVVMDCLTKRFGDVDRLPSGVRHIFDMTGLKMFDLEELLENERYVCSSDNHFKKMEYKFRNPWSVGMAAFLNQPARSPLTPRSVGGACAMNGACNNGLGGSGDTKFEMKPRKIFIMKNGRKPRPVFPMLLNKKTAHSYEQVMIDISEKIKLDSGSVKKLYTMEMKKVRTLEDFFMEDFVFFAYGNEKYAKDDFTLDSVEYECTRRANARTSIGGAVNVQSYRRIGSTTNSPRRNFSSSPSSSISESDKSIRGQSPKRYSHNRNTHETNGTTNTQHSPASDELNGECPREIAGCYQVGKLIGEGNFAVVRQCTKMDDGCMYALKIIDKTKWDGKEHLISNEVNILRQLKHDNIVMLKEDKEHNNNIYLVMELVEGGDLFDAIESAKKFTEVEASSMIRDLASALSYLHAKRIVHRDVKPENLLVSNGIDSRLTLKLGDFGLAVECDDNLLTTVCGTPTYVAPEMLEETGYDVGIDVWAMGVITYILLCGFPPFSSEQNVHEELFRKIMECDYSFPSPYWDDVSSLAKDIVSQMLTLDMRDRILAENVLKHQWLRASADAYSNGIAPLRTKSQLKKKKTAMNHQDRTQAANVAILAVKPNRRISLQS